MHLVDPALRVALLRGSGVDFGCNGDYTSDVASLGLGTAHAAKTGGDEELACRATA